MVHRPGSVQTEIRIGHRGLPRRIADFHAVSVMSAILGGLFNSRLNMQLREEKGYTYGAGAGFDLRRAAGPFTARAAVNTEVTVPAVAGHPGRTRADAGRAVTDDGARRRRATSSSASSRSGSRPPGAVVGALSGLVVHDLPVDELVDYRRRIEAVDIDAVRPPRGRICTWTRRPIVLVGDVDAFGPALEAAGLGTIVIDRDEGPALAGPLPEDEESTEPGPADDDAQSGPTAGAEEPSLPGTDDEPVGADLSSEGGGLDG